MQTSWESLRKLSAFANASFNVRPGCTCTVVRCWLGKCARTTDRRGDCGVERATSSHTPLLPIGDKKDRISTPFIKKKKGVWHLKTEKYLQSWKKLEL